MLIQSSTLILLAIAALLLCYAIAAPKSKTIKLISFMALCLCVRFSYLQMQWIEMAIHETMRKSAEWNAHDIAVSSFMFLFALYMAFVEKEKEQ